MEFPQLENLIYKKGTLRSPSYYVGSAGNVSAETIRRYIEEAQHL
jgi:putative transposase